MIQFNSFQADKYRQIINKAALSLSDEDAAYAPMIFEYWEQDRYYNAGERVCYVGRLYKVL